MSILLRHGSKACWIGLLEERDRATQGGPMLRLAPLLPARLPCAPMYWRLKELLLLVKHLAEVPGSNCGILGWTWQAGAGEGLHAAVLSGPEAQPGAGGARGGLLHAQGARLSLNQGLRVLKARVPYRIPPGAATYKIPAFLKAQAASVLSAQGALHVVCSAFCCGGSCCACSPHKVS